MKKYFFILLLISIPLYSAENFYYITPLSGLKMREKPSINSKTLLILPYKANIKVLEIGKTDLINGKSNKWYRISFYNDTGWIFGEYIKSTVPISYYHKYAYKSEDNNSARIFFILFNDNTFSIYYHFLEDSESMLFYGSWVEEGDFIKFSFNKNQKCNPVCDPDALFYDKQTNITKNNDGSYKIKKDVKQISIWNILCPNVKYWPLFQYK